MGILTLNMAHMALSENREPHDPSAFLHSNAHILDKPTGGCRYPCCKSHGWSSFAIIFPYLFIKLPFWVPSSLGPISEPRSSKSSLGLVRKKSGWVRRAAWPRWMWWKQWVVFGFRSRRREYQAKSNQIRWLPDEEWTWQ